MLVYFRKNTPCVCLCVWGNACDCYRWPPSRWENAGSLLVCVHMYQTQHVFPFQRRGILYECVYSCVWLSPIALGDWLPGTPAAKTGTVCFLLSHTVITGRTHTRMHGSLPYSLFPLQVSSTPILVPPAVKMFRSDCHERTCSPGPQRRTQIGEEWRHPRSAAAFFLFFFLLTTFGCSLWFGTLPLHLLQPFKCLIQMPHLAPTHLIFFPIPFNAPFFFFFFPISHHLLGYLFPRPVHPSCDPLSLSDGCRMETDIKIWKRQYMYILYCLGGYFVAHPITKERWEEQYGKDRNTMAMLQTIAINGIIYFPQRLRWGNNEAAVAGGRESHRILSEKKRVGIMPHEPDEFKRIQIDVRCFYFA